MPLPDEKTIAVNLWPNMLMIEGPAKNIASLILQLYDDPAVPNDQWNIAHNDASRKTYAQALLDSTIHSMRKGMGVGRDDLVPIVEARARSLGLSIARLSQRS